MPSSKNEHNSSTERGASPPATTAPGATPVGSDAIADAPPAAVIQTQTDINIPSTTTSASPNDRAGIVTPHPSDSLVSSATLSQRLAVEEFMRSPNQENWGELVELVRRGGLQETAAPLAQLGDAPGDVNASSSYGEVRPEVIDDDGPPLAAGMLDDVVSDDVQLSKGGLLEVVDGDGDDGPPLPFGMTGDLDLADEDDEPNKMTGVRVEHIEGDDDPDGPFFAPELSLGNLVKKIDQDQGAGIDGGAARNDEDSIIIPSREEIVDGTVSPIENRRGIERLQRPRTSPNSNDSSPGPNVDNASDGQFDDPVSVPGGEEGDHRSTLVIPEAFAVGDEAVIVASPLEPALPWYKQRRAKGFLGAGTVLLVGLAVGLGVALTSNEPATAVTFVVGSSAPSLSLVPTSHPTLTSSHVPSMTSSPSTEPTSHPSGSTKPSTLPSFKPSPFPSSSPSACANKIITNKQSIDLPLDDPQNPVVAIDGQNMVVVAREGDTDGGGPVLIAFYSTENGEWQRLFKNTFREDDLVHGYSADVVLGYSAAMSGKTALVGFWEANDKAGTVLVFEQDKTGGWQKVGDPFVRDVNSATDDYLFGWHVDIDGNLACVEDNDKAHLFRRKDDNKWIQFGMIAGGELCSISGDTIAVWDIAIRGLQDDVLEDDAVKIYRYDRDLDEVVPIQDPIPLPTRGWVNSMDLSNDYLVYWDVNVGKDAIMYRRDPRNQTFSFLQQFNITGPWDNDGLALDNDILAISGTYNTHIFSEQDGNWVESITLDRLYHRFALSGRTLLAATESEVHSFNIEDCSQAMPTQTPSLSAAPTDIQLPPPTTSPTFSPSTGPSFSFFPSMSPSSSVAPSTSFSPTETCYWIQIAIVYDDYPSNTYFYLDRLDDYDGTLEVIKYHEGSDGDTSHVESICLQKGRYGFTIFDRLDVGICCEYGEGHYNVTTLDGALIVEGGEWTGWYEETLFSIPYVPGTSTTESFYW